MPTGAAHTYRTVPIGQDVEEPVKPSHAERLRAISRSMAVQVGARTANSPSIEMSPKPQLN